MEVTTVLVAFLAALGAVGSSVVTYLIYRVSKDPEAIVYAQHDDDRPSVIQLVIENIGKGVALDVRFSFDRPMPRRAWGIEGSTGPFEPMSDGPFANGIPMLQPTGKRVFDWGQYGGIAEHTQNKTIKITAMFKSPSRVFPTMNIHETVSLIDIRSFSGTGANDSPMRTLTKAVEGVGKKVERHLSAFASTANQVQADLRHSRSSQRPRTAAFSPTCRTSPAAWPAVRRKPRRGSRSPRP